MPRKLHLKKGDLVITIAGKDKGKTGKILRVLPKRERVVVEGINFIKKHTRARSQEQQGGIVRQEAPLHISNVEFYCSRCSRGGRLGRRKLENGARVRFCRRCGEQVDKG